MLSPSASESTIVSPSLSNFDDFGSSLMPPLSSSMLDSLSIASAKFSPDRDPVDHLSTKPELVMNSLKSPEINNTFTKELSPVSTSDLATEDPVSDPRPLTQEANDPAAPKANATPHPPKPHVSETTPHTMSASPSTNSPIGSQGMFGTNNNNTNASHGNNNGGVLRSPSLSSASGSGSAINSGGSHSGSASSATTTMTTTQSSSLLGNNNGSGTTVVGSVTGSAGVSDVKLKRFLEHNQRLKEQLEMRRISVSEASQSLIQFVTSTKDSLLPGLWGIAPSDPFSKPSTGCCTIS
ncbi:hypothetical protein BGZ70_004174 [Mortierella alpina]|uniref:Guanine nucleotide-binding protein subunit gamma n=1 Tax=Mortierella alpina TaxID=64518 RepID=A0A9P6JA93_MORAP|nr:hypothetical protein BGZ70_004174 [Mortierella alpina]